MTLTDAARSGAVGGRGAWSGQARRASSRLSLELAEAIKYSVTTLNPPQGEARVSGRFGTKPVSPGLRSARSWA